MLHPQTPHLMILHKQNTTSASYSSSCLHLPIPFFFFWKFSTAKEDLLNFTTKPSLILLQHKKKLSEKKDKNKLCLYRIYKFVFGEISKRKTGENDPKKKSGKRIELSSSCYDPTGGRRKKIRAVLTFDHVMMILSSFGTKSQFAGSLSFKTTCVLLIFFLNGRLLGIKLMVKNVNVVPFLLGHIFCR